MEFIKGVDISSVQQIEDNGGKYYDEGIGEDCLKILKNNGINYIRLRIWNNPPLNYCNKAKTLEMAKRIKDLDFKFLLDFHYSDFWADPQKQTKPKEWQSLTFDELKEAVYYYTKDIITSLKNQGTLPDMIQIGNEIVWGMLWPDAKLSKENNSNEQWGKFADLIKAGIDGVKSTLTSGDVVKIMIHIDRGGDNDTSRWFFDNLLSNSVNFDIIGQSYYPNWHGTLPVLEANLNDLALRYGKEIVVVECAYPFTLESNDGFPNIVNSENQLHRGYPASIDGQTHFMRDLMNIVKNVPNEKGLGIFYWEPAWISVPKTGWAPGEGNGWENLTMFDFQGNTLEALKFFKEF